MPNNTINSSALLTPAQVGELLIQPVIADSVAAQVAQVVLSNTNAYRVPIVTRDPKAAWVAEGAEIPVDNLEVDELVIVPTKVAGLNYLTNEMVADSDPAVIEVVGAGLARDIARQLDRAYFGSAMADGPSGLGSLTGIQSVNAGADFVDLDWAAEAISLVQTVGATVGAFVTTPATALTLAKLKAGVGSNIPLLSSDPTSPTKRLIAGVPLIVSTAVEANTIWAIPTDRTLIVMRKDAEITSDSSVAYSSDRTAVRAVMRVGVGFPHAAAIVKIEKKP